MGGGIIKSIIGSATLVLPAEPWCSLSGLDSFTEAVQDRRIRGLSDYQDSRGPWEPRGLRAAACRGGCPWPARSRGGGRPDLAAGDEGFDGFAFEHPAVVFDFGDDFGERTKKPPLIHPPSSLGFSWKAYTWLFFRPSAPKRATGSTEVRVTSLPCDLWKAMVAWMSMLARPSPYVMKKASSSSSTWRCGGGGLRCRVVAGIDQGDAPGFGDGVVDGHLVVGDVEGDV